jgi:hypothetical protein
LWKYGETVCQQFLDLKKACDLVRGKVLYNVPIEFGVLVRLTKISLNEIYSKVHIGKHLCDIFPIQNGQKQGDALSPLLFSFALEKVQENQVGMRCMRHISFWLMQMMSIC